MTAPTVSIVIVPRERFSFSRASLESLHANNRQPLNVVYVDVGSPPKVQRYLERLAKVMTLIRLDTFVSPNAARNIGLARATGEFVLFLDNDCILSPGCIETLVKCARETGATAVAPMYFERDSRRTLTHMAGAWVDHHNGLAYVHHKQPLLDVAYPTDLFEFHCVLIRRDWYPYMDEALPSALEQEDTSLEIQANGGTIYLEPRATATYVVGPIDRHDAAYVRFRWSQEANASSVRHFEHKWSLPVGWGDTTIDWCNAHRERILALERPWWKPLGRLK